MTNLDFGSRIPPTSPACDRRPSKRGALLSRVCRYSGALLLVGLSMRGKHKAVDKVTEGLKPHRFGEPLQLGSFFGHVLVPAQVNAGDVAVSHDVLRR